MEYKTSQTKLRILTQRIHFLFLLSTGLLITNIFLVWLVAWSFTHQKRIIVPTEVSQAFTVSDYAVDASYLRQMALFFVAERLNLTPSNVVQNQHILLQYTAPEFYSGFSHILAEEKKAVVKQKISSVFYPMEIVPDAKNLQVLIRGSLARWVGSLSLAPIKKTYLLKFSYQLGNLKVKSFAEIKDKTKERQDV